MAPARQIFLSTTQPPTQRTQLALRSSSFTHPSLCALSLSVVAVKAELGIISLVFALSFLHVVLASRWSTSYDALFPSNETVLQTDILEPEPLAYTVTHPYLPDHAIRVQRVDCWCDHTVKCVASTVEISHSALTPAPEKYIHWLL